MVSQSGKPTNPSSDGLQIWFNAMQPNPKSDIAA
jgi:hypothetical protein